MKQAPKSWDVMEPNRVIGWDGCGGGREPWVGGDILYPVYHVSTSYSIGEGFHIFDILVNTEYSVYSTIPEFGESDSFNFS